MTTSFSVHHCKRLPVTLALITCILISLYQSDSIIKKFQPTIAATILSNQIQQGNEQVIPSSSDIVSINKTNNEKSSLKMIEMQEDITAEPKKIFPKDDNETHIPGIEVSNERDNSSEVLDIIEYNQSSYNLTLISYVGNETLSSNTTVWKYQSQSNTKRNFVAVLSCIKSVQNWQHVNETSVYSLFLPSLWSSITEEEKIAYRIEVILAYDTNDTFWETSHNRAEMINSYPLPLSFISVVNHKKHHIPFNELCRSAYEYGAEYLVRLNDDTQILTTGWISKGIQTLQSYDPPNVGVVGPTCNEGNVDILTHDMVHRTHLEIFDNYYPDEFDNWWIDDWISKVYGNHRTTKRRDWLVKHHIHQHGTRYKVDHSQRPLLKELLRQGSERVEVYLTSGLKANITQVLGTSQLSLAEGPISDF
jgi:hypothetical protein